MAFINFINAGGDPETEAKLSAMTQDFTTTIERTVSSITIPSGTTVVGENAFASCSALTEVVIPASVTSIEPNAFGENRSLETINFEGTTPPTVAEGAFSQLPENVEINVPEGAEDAYSAVTEEIEDSTAMIVEYTDLSGNTVVWYSKYPKISLYDADNPQPTAPEAGWAKVETKGITELNDNCLMGEPSVEYVFDENLKTTKCTPLRGSLPTKVTYKSTSYDYFDARICESCTNLSSITFYCQSAPLQYAEYTSTSNTAYIGELCIPNGGKDYDLYKQYICGEYWTIKDLSGNTMNLKMQYTDIYSHSGTYNFYNEIPSYFFYNNTELVEVVLPDACNDILTGTFQDCSALTAVTIPSTCWRIQFAVFNSCTALTNITCYATTAPEISDRWGDEPFRNVSPTGTLNIPSGKTASYSAWTAQLGSGWTVNEMGDEATPYCEIDSTDWIRDYGVNIKVGTSPAPIRIMYNDEQTLTIVDGRILYMQPIGEFSVNYDAENDDLVVIENSSQEPITQQQKEAMFEYVGVNYDSDYGFIKYDFGEIDTVTVDNDDYTGLYTYCEYIEDMA